MTVYEYHTHLPSHSFYTTTILSYYNNKHINTHTTHPHEKSSCIMQDHVCEHQDLPLVR